MLYMLFIYMYKKAFLVHLIKAWERTSKKKKEKLENINWNGSTEYEIEKVEPAR